MNADNRANASRAWLRPLSAVYGLVLRLRNAAYDRGWLPQRRAAVPVISVGNITVGGTGKTPFVIELARRLIGWDRRPAILTRGYRGSAEQPADEVLELQDALPDVPIVVNADRVAGAAEAHLRHGADCLVLDDGFQHRRLARQLDIVLIDALDPFGGGHTLPAGRLREPLSGLRRADLVVVTRANQAAAQEVRAVVDALQSLVGDQPVIEATVEIAGLAGLDGTTQDPESLRGQRVLAVCGIGNPRSFLLSVRALTANVQPMHFADHHHYTSSDVRQIRAAATQFNADWVVTTRKDWVKLAPGWPPDGPRVVRLDMRPGVRAGEDALNAALRQALERQD
jgi:tetraacyldisaccharide 4'-kinase